MKNASTSFHGSRATAASMYATVLIEGVLFLWGRMAREERFLERPRSA